MRTRKHHGIAPGTHRLIGPRDAAEAVKTAKGNKATAARALNMSTRTLDRILARDTERAACSHGPAPIV